MNLMQPRPRKSRAVNAYASLYGKERGLEQKISAAYTKYIDQLPPGADAKRQLTVREESLRALYAAEPQDVKDAVEAFRNRPPPAPWMDDLADDVTPDEEEVAMLMYLLRYVFVQFGQLVVGRVRRSSPCDCRQPKVVVGS